MDLQSPFPGYLSLGRAVVNGSAVVGRPSVTFSSWLAEMKQFEWNQALVMIHGHDRIKTSIRSFIEQGIRRVGTGGDPSMLLLRWQL